MNRKLPAPKRQVYKNETKKMMSLMMLLGLIYWEKLEYCSSTVTRLESISKIVSFSVFSWKLRVGSSLLASQ
jgi:hypothetical protein